MDCPGVHDSPGPETASRKLPGVSILWRTGIVFTGWILVLHLSASLASGEGESLVAPPPPAVPPVIRSVYTSDSDRNRIDDELENHAPKGRSFQGLRVEREKTEVELIFTEPVTQTQIDAYLELGGEISYIYKAVSYGWQGRLAAADIAALPEAMGSTLVQVAPVYQVKPYMDMASQTGRVRPIWRPGFAARLAGFHGDPNTTIAFIDSGMDDTHPDLAGRGVYWNDVSADRDVDPIDYEGHGSAVAGVALGTGQAGGAEDSELRYTYTANWPSWAYYAAPIALPSGPVAVASRAYWHGASAWLEHVLWRRGTELGALRWIGNGQQGASQASYTNTVDASARDVFSAVVANWSYSNLNEVVIVNSVPGYPGVGDGYNKFRGVAPGCNWAAVKFYDKDGTATGSGFSAAMDDLVAHRIEKNIQIINFSSGLDDEEGFPARSEAVRDKVASVVRNGIIVVVAAGNGADQELEASRAMADPAAAALAITVGATGDENQLTNYSTYGFTDPRVDTSEGFKPDLVAPGGSYYYTGITSVDTGSYDVYPSPDREPNDYTSQVGTSLASPFVAGCAALVIEAMTQQGVQWDFHSDEHPRFVKMLLCATASETHVDRENGRFNPTLDRASDGPGGFPPAKDRYEGYGIVNPDAAVEAISLSYTPGEPVAEELGPGATDRRVWARTVDLTAGEALDVWLNNPSEADFDLYLYSTVASPTGAPVILASSTDDRVGAGESIAYTPDSDMTALLVVKRVSGSGEFELGPVAPGPETGR